MDKFIRKSILSILVMTILSVIWRTASDAQTQKLAKIWQYLYRLLWMTRFDPGSNQITAAELP